MTTSIASKLHSPSFHRCYLHFIVHKSYRQGCRNSFLDSLNLVVKFIKVIYRVVVIAICILDFFWRLIYFHKKPSHRVVVIANCILACFRLIHWKLVISVFDWKLMFSSSQLFGAAPNNFVNSFLSSILFDLGHIFIEFYRIIGCYVKFRWFFLRFRTETRFHIRV